MRFAITKPKIRPKAAREGNEPEWKLIHKVVDNLEPATIRKIYEAKQRVIDETDWQGIIDAVIDGDIDAAADLFPFERYNVLFVSELNGQLAKAEDSGAIVTRQFADPPTQQGVIHYSSFNKLSDFHDLIPDQRAAIRQSLQDVITLGGETPSHALMSDLLQAHVGLNPQQIRSLDRGIQGFMAKGLPPDAISKYAVRTADRMERQRAATIARTELSNAVATGQIREWQEQLGSGMIETDSKMAWVVTPDDLLCETICAPMESQIVTFKSYFVTGEGSKIKRPPAHPNCRCSVKLIRAGLTSRQEARRKTPTKPPLQPMSEKDALDWNSAGVAKWRSPILDKGPEHPDYNAYDNGYGHYVGSGYRQINPMMRTGDYRAGYYPGKEAVQQGVKDMMKIMDKYAVPIPANMKIYRGTSTKYVNQVGKTVPDGGFGSVTVTRDDADHFARRKGEDGIVLELTVKPGLKGLPTGSFEGEIIVPPNTPITITRISGDTAYGIIG